MKKSDNPKEHNIHFYKPKCRAVYCIALQSAGLNNKLALSRSDSSIEIWNLEYNPFIEKTIPPSTENYSIEGLSWCDSRLFSVGLHGFLIEYDLYKLTIKNKSVVTGEAAFCIDINKQKNKIAVGTEQGYLNIFQLHEDEVYFEKFLDKQEGRILCLKFDHSGEYIVSGGLDAIRVWSVSTNQAIHKMITGRSEQNKPTIIWCLAVTSNFTILSGDSRGILSVWDGKVGAQVESYQSHRADILSMCLSEDETSLFCAGVDPSIVNYVNVTVKGNAQKWVRSIQRKIHDHDVRVLCLNGDKLYSSGIDGYLACSYHPPKTLIKYPPILQTPITICEKAYLVMLRYPKHLEIWSLGEASAVKDKSTGLYHLKKKPKKLVVLQKIVKNDAGEEKKEGIICASISENGKRILYSTRLGVTLFALSFELDKLKLTPIQIEDLDETPCLCAVFASNDRLVLASNDGVLKIVAFDIDRAAVVQNINIRSEIEDTMTCLVASKCGNILSACDVRGNIAIWSFTNNRFTCLCKLPKFKLCPTTMAIHPLLPNLVVTFSNGSLIEYDYLRKELTQFSRSLSQNPKKQLTARTSTMRNITFDPRKPHVIILHDDDSVIVIDKKTPPQKEKKAKISRVEIQIEQQFSIRSIKRQKHLVHLNWLSEDEMVAVEVNPLSLIEQLSPCLIQSTFGRK